MTVRSSCRAQRGISRSGDPSGWALGMTVRSSCRARRGISRSGDPSGCALGMTVRSSCRAQRGISRPGDPSGCALGMTVRSSCRAQRGISRPGDPSGCALGMTVNRTLAASLPVSAIPAGRLAAGEIGDRISAPRTLLLKRRQSRRTPHVLRFALRALEFWVHGNPRHPARWDWRLPCVLSEPDLVRMVRRPDLVGHESASTAPVTIVPGRRRLIARRPPPPLRRGWRAPPSGARPAPRRCPGRRRPSG